MTATPNPTAEQIVEEALNRIDLYADELPKAVVSTLRAHGLLSEGASSEERRGINLMRDLGFDESDPEVVKARADAAFEEQIERAARAYDPEAWAARDKYAADGTGTQVELDLMVEYSIGKARAALTAAGVAPQEPSQTKTKSGNNFVSLDPEKVAEVISYANTALDDLPSPGSTAEALAHALCEAYMEGKLTK